MNSEPSFSKTGIVTMTTKNGCDHRRPFKLQHQFTNRVIDLHQRPADRVVLFAVDFADEHCIDDAAKKLGSET